KTTDATINKILRFRIKFVGFKMTDEDSDFYVIALQLSEASPTSLSVNLSLHRGKPDSYVHRLRDEFVAQCFVASVIYSPLRAVNVKIGLRPEEAVFEVNSCGK